MNLAWIAIGGSICAVLLAVLWARRVNRRIERLTQTYWELRYEHGQLSSRVTRIESPGDAGAQGGAADASRPMDEGRPQTAFVPLSSLRK